MAPVRSIRILLCVVVAMVAATSCSPKDFTADNTGGGGGSGTPPVTITGNVNCSPVLNGSATLLNMTTSSANPTLTSNCTPVGATHNWTVTRGGVPVTIAGLGGASSTPDFAAAGAGTYLIGLNATAIGHTDFNLMTPLTVVVTSSGPPPAGTIACTPRLNGTLTTITTSANPTVTANCTPAGVSYVWTAQKDGNPIVITGLSGASSTPSISANGPGTYTLWLNASSAGYTSFTATTPLTVIVPPGGGGPTNVHETHTITPGNNKLDILLVLDDSSSMASDNMRLATRLQTFVNSLGTSGMDWQMCLTLTRAQRISSADPNLYWGASVNWSGNPNTPQWILKAGTANTYQIFTDTVTAVGAGWVGTEDERAIKAAYWHLWNGDPSVSGASGCYRPDAGLAVIILSDEDERSIAGDQTQVFYEHERNLSLETDDLPATYIHYVKDEVFNSAKRFTVNSIIVRPGDTACLAAQDAEGSKAHYGTKYNELSTLTGGYVGDICDTNYAAHLEYFAGTIISSQASVPLQCAPVSTPVVAVSPLYTHTTTVATSPNRLLFTPQVPVGSTVDVQYTCP